MTPLKPHPAFPAKASFARSIRYEIRRSRDDINGGSYRLPADQPQRNGMETGYKTKEQAWAACDRINAPNGACIVINVRKEVLEDLIESERGSWDDIETQGGICITGRPAEFHVFAIAQRHPSRLIIRCKEEAEDAYYAVCSGTFSIQNLACYRAAVRIADALRQFAEPDTVKMWPQPPKPSLLGSSRKAWKA